MMQAEHLFNLLFRFLSSAMKWLGHMHACDRYSGPTMHAGDKYVASSKTGVQCPSNPGSCLLCASEGAALVLG